MHPEPTFGGEFFIKINFQAQLKTHFLCWPQFAAESPPALDRSVWPSLRKGDLRCVMAGGWAGLSPASLDETMEDFVKLKTLLGALGF